MHPLSPPRRPRPWLTCACSKITACSWNSQAARAHKCTTLEREDPDARLSLRCHFRAVAQLPVVCCARVCSKRLKQQAPTGIYVLPAADTLRRQ